jgi:hypothetical protein
MGAMHTHARGLRSFSPGRSVVKGYVDAGRVIHQLFQCRSSAVQPVSTTNAGLV